MTRREMTAEQFDEHFDSGGDISDFIDPAEVSFPNRPPQRKININMPAWLIEELDGTARHLAVNRQAVINMWLAERVEQERDKKQTTA